MKIWRTRGAIESIRTAASILISVTLALPLAAQQVGDADRDLVINGRGSLQPSFVTTSVPTPGSLQLEYRTVNTFAPVLVAAATQGQIGWTTTPLSSIDIGPGGLTVLLDGRTGTGLASLLLSTGSDGRFAISFGLSPSLSGASPFVAAAHVTAAAPSGFFVSQTHALTFATFCPQPPIVETFDDTIQRDHVDPSLDWSGSGSLAATPLGNLFGSGSAGAISFAAGQHEIDTSLVPTPSGVGSVASVLHVPGGVLEVTSFTINSGATVRVFGDYPLDVRATGAVTIDGTLDAGAFAEPLYSLWSPGMGQFNNGSILGGSSTVIRGGRGGPGAGDGGRASFAGVNRTPRGEAGEGPRIGGGPVGPGHPAYGGGEGGIGDFFNAVFGLPGGQGGAGGSARGPGEDGLPLSGSVSTGGLSSCGAPITPTSPPALATLPVAGYDFFLDGLLGGSGGGGGGDKFDSSPPSQLFDEQAGAGGGGGGAVGITAMGPVSVTGSIRADGGAGSLGPTFTGGGGGGSGGMIWIRSADAATFGPGAILDVSGGDVALGTISCVGAPGRGGAGVIVVQDDDGAVSALPMIMPGMGSFALFPLATVRSGSATSLFYDSGFDVARFTGVTATVVAPVAGSFVTVEVQGAAPDPTTPTQPSADPAHRTAWIPASQVTNDPTLSDPLDGARFVRFRITMTWFGSLPAAGLPSVEDISIAFDGDANCP